MVCCFPTKNLRKMIWFHFLLHEVYKLWFGWVLIWERLQFQFWYIYWKTFQPCSSGIRSSTAVPLHFKSYFLWNKPGMNWNTWYFRLKSGEKKVTLLVYAVIKLLYRVSDTGAHVSLWFLNKDWRNNVFHWLVNPFSFKFHVFMNKAQIVFP